MTTTEVARVGQNEPFYQPELVVQPATPGLKDDADKASLKSSDTSPTFAGSLSPRVNHVVNKITENLQAPGSVFAPETGNIIITDEKTGETREFSRQELRQQYEDDEVDRFLRVFARQVHEVQMPQGLPPDIPRKDPVPMDASIPPLKGIEISDDEEEWHIEPESSSMVDTIKQAVSSPTATLSAAADKTTMAAQTIKENTQHTYTLLDEGEWHGRSPAEYVAMEWIVPYLPRPHRKTYQFTLGGMQGTVTRLYLACQPLYAPFMARMASLMSWENPRRSLLYCALFWVLWFFDLLMPALMARLCFSLLRRGLLPYPTAEELAERRTAEARADAVGDSIHTYLDGSLAKGVRLRDAWTVFRIATKNKKNKAKSVVADDNSESPSKDDIDEAYREDENMRRFALALMEEAADFHERFANLYHWRDPAASIRYSIILAIMIPVAIFSPYKYVIKGAYAAGGFGFWFIPNLWMALPIEHRSRIPPPLGDVPTDAEYAMSIISARVDRGENVLPPERRKKDKKSSSTTNLSTYSISPSNTFSSMNRSATTVGSNVDDKSFVSVNHKPRGFTAKVITAGLTDQSKRKESHDENGEPLPEQTFPAKYHANMGVLSLTSESLLFYPMMSSNAKVAIPLKDIRGVKKAGRMGGLRVKYVIRGGEPQASQSVRQYVDDLKKDKNADPITVPVTSAANGEPLEKEEKFGWISGRDEVFAKLVGWGGRRWVKM